MRNLKQLPIREIASRRLLPPILRVLRALPKPAVRGAGGILVFKPDRIGDFVLAAECIRRIRDRFSRVRCSVVVSEPMLSLAQRELDGVSLLALPAAHRSFFLSLFKAWRWGRTHLGPVEWDLMVNLRYNLTIREDLVLASVRAKDSCGVARGLNAHSWPDRLAVFKPTSEIAYPRGHSVPPYELVAHEKLLSSLGCECAPYKPRLNSWNDEKGNYLLLSPFGSESIRSYPTHLLIEAFSRANLATDLRIKICVEPSRVSEAKSLLHNLLRRGFSQTEVVMPTDTLLFIDCVASAKAVVAMESAAAHIAIVLGKPGVFIVGGGHYGAFAPWVTNTAQHWISNQLPCFGCDWECIRSVPECITQISPREVAHKLSLSLAYKSANSLALAE
jgi:ADP-heptose:LPS heptosyltransferase